jgi:cytochrome c biogenesis protein CcdA
VVSGIFFGGSLIAAVIAGAIALFAPCCISFMLPAYLANAFQNRRMLVAMTFLFAAGVATIILPIALGASLLRQVFAVGHPVIYVAGGILLLGLATYTLLGGQIHLPTPGGHKSGNRAGPFSVYTLGVFSGITSSCCAPVLAGVIALSSAAPSFAVALGLGVAYVFGMVAPLFGISLLWERYDWRSNRLLRRRTFTYQIGGVRRTLSGTQLASGLLLAALGPVMIWVGLTYSSMARLAGWQLTMDLWLQKVGSNLTDALSWLPNWLGIVLVALAVALLARRALRQIEPTKPPDTTPESTPPHDTPSASTEEVISSSPAQGGHL